MGDAVRIGGFTPRQLAMICLAIGAVVIPVIVWLDRRRTSSTADQTSGQVIGIVGRMGSGKSYMAVRMAYRRLEAGAKVCSNFTMKLPPHLEQNWSKFTGWHDLVALEDTVVIIDEAHLLAPSSEHIRFPMLARWKMAQARKFGLDIYWISQHEARVNNTLKALTSMIYVCERFTIGGRSWFKALGYEPEKVRKKMAHIDRRGYWFDLEIASLYDTLEILDVDSHLSGDDFEVARGVLEERNQRRATGAAEARGGRAGAPAASSWSIPLEQAHQS